MSQRHRPGLDYPYLACLQAQCAEDLVDGDIVWCTSTPSKRMVVSKAAATSPAAGCDAVLFSVVKGGITGGRCLVSLVHVRPGGPPTTAGAPVYLSDTPGAISPTPGTNARIVGSATGNGIIFGAVGREDNLP
jgi:hypothetical protein